jgi:benzoyl-CoA reductase/2-hydroxyglutaryl-CoA dehydratase subunit BcrC/BadD/HgdB
VIYPEEDYRSMWRELGLNLELHDELMAEMTSLHRKNFLSQTQRPEAMGRFDHSYHASHAGRVAEISAYRKRGGKAIGTFCIYVPDEIALAADVLPIPLCGGTDFTVPYADKMLPRDICPLIRSTFGMAFSGTCPYGPLKDLIVGETTCDAKKKTWDLLGFEVLEVPQKKEAMDRDLWRREVFRFRDVVEKITGVTILAEKLRDCIRLVNRKREALQKINAFRMMDNPPISGLDALLVSQMALNQDIHGFIRDCQELIAELEERRRRGISAYPAGGKRVMIAGTPSAMGYAKIHHIAETSGLQIVCDETCTGRRYFKDLVDDSAEDLEGLLNSVADRYFSIDCSCFSPNTERLDNITRLASEYRVDGVIQNILQYCHGYNIEARAVDKRLKTINIPTLTIVTDYSQEDYGQIRTRIEAFAELME